MFQRTLRRSATRACPERMSLVSRRMATNALTPAQMNELGLSVIASGDLDQAAQIFQLLCEAGMAESGALLSLGVALEAAGKSKEALEWTGNAVALDPENPLGFHVLAHLFIEIEAFSAGADAARQALRLQPNLAKARAQLGHCLQKLKRPDEAVTELRHALELNPIDASAYLDLGNAHQDLGEWMQAEAAFDHAAGLEPGSAKPHYNLGNLLQRTGRRSDALAAYDRALRIAPEDAALRLNAGLLQLTVEDFEQGWRNFEWRWKAPAERPFVRDCEAALWSGQEDVQGKRLLIQAEQGLGDTIQFIRYAPLLAAMGAQVVVDAPASLQALLGAVEGVDQVVAPGQDLPPTDFRCPTMSLPLALGVLTPLSARKGGYLAVDPHSQRKWNNRFEPYDRPLVGLAYAGNASHTNDRNRSIDLCELISHLPVGPRYIVLQTDIRDGDADCFAARDDIEWLGPELADFMDTAAASMCLDLIVTVDTAIAHLAGALDRPTHVLLPFEPDWRWGFDRSTCLWYPSLTLHRQLRSGDWSDPLQAVANIIATVVDERRGVISQPETE